MAQSKAVTAASQSPTRELVLLSDKVCKGVLGSVAWAPGGPQTLPTGALSHRSVRRQDSLFHPPLAMGLRTLLGLRSDCSASQGGKFHVPGELLCHQE